MDRGDQKLDWFLERIAVAFVSAVAAVLTLALFPIAILILGGGFGGGVEIEVGAAFYALAFSKVGVTIVGVAALTGFCVGGERMANSFSFFWGTHSIWSKLGAYIEDKTVEWNTEHVPVTVLVALLVVFAVFMWVWVAKP